MNDEERFRLEHETMLSASLWGCLVLPPEHRPGWAPSPFSYAMHLSRQSPFPAKTGKILKGGRMMEPVAAVCLKSDHGITVRTHPDDLGRVRRERADLPAVTYLDGLVDDNTAIEIKNPRSWIYRDAWADGPPLWVRVQCQAQLLLDPNLARVLIVPVVISSSEYPEVPQIYEEFRDDPNWLDGMSAADARQMLESEGRNFLEMLRRGELPPPDETVASYEAIKRTLKLEPSEVVTLADDESAKQFVWWQQAKHQAKAGDEMQEAAKRFFAARAGNATVIELPGVGRIERKQVTVKAEDQPRPARIDMRWLLKEE